MRRGLIVMAGLIGTVGLGGCLPEKRVIWSPDGRWAAVRGADGLYLSDASGKLSARLIERVSAVAWLPDSTGLVLCKADPSRSWDELAGVVTEAQRAELERRAPALRAEILAYEGDWDAFKPSAVTGLTGGQTLALFTYVREKLGAGLAEKLGSKWDEFQKLSAAVYSLEIAALGSDGTLKPGRVLARALDAFDELRVAPTGKAVAYRGGAPGDEATRPLLAVPTDGSTVPRPVAEHTAMFPDWSVDGRYLVYAATRTPGGEDGKELRLGVIARRQVCAADGRPLASPPEAEELAGIAFQNEVRVRCLRDGRVLFATLPVQLPCTSKDMPQRAGLFAVDPGRQPTVTALLPRQADEELPDVMFLFEVSPDEQHICVAGANGRIAVLTLTDGQVWNLVDENEVDHLRLPPAWRSADELCFAVVPGPAEAKQRAEIVLAKLDWSKRQAQRKVISADWPEAVVTDFLVEKEKATPGK